jgi:hypothetical protein
MKQEEQANTHLSRYRKNQHELEEAQEHCDEALRLLAPPRHTDNTFEDRPHPQEDGPHPLGDRPYTALPIELPQTMDNLSPTNENPPLLLPKPHPLLLQLLRAIVRLSWQTGRDKRQWEGPGQGLHRAPPFLPVGVQRHHSGARGGGLYQWRAAL